MITLKCAQLVVIILCLSGYDKQQHMLVLHAHPELYARSSAKSHSSQLLAPGRCFHCDMLAAAPRLLMTYNEVSSHKALNASKLSFCVCSPTAHS